MARLRLARARAAEIVQEHKPEAPETEGEQEKPSSTGGQQQQASALVPPTSSRLLLGRRSFKSRRQQQQQPQQHRLPPPLAPSGPSHAALWLSKTWPGLASYSSRVARRRCAKGLPPPALPPAILRQATLQKSRSVDSGHGGRGGAGGRISADGSSNSGSLSRAPSLPSPLLLTTPHGRGLVSGNDIFYDARGGSILTGDGNGSIDGGCGGNGGVTSEMLRALAAEVEQQMAEEERAAAAALKSAGSSKGGGSAVGKKAAAAVDSEGEELDDEDEEERGGEAAAAACSSSDCASALVLSREPGWHSSLFRPSRRLRQGLPPICETGRRPSMWSLICSLCGKASHDLHSVSVPAHFNEPLTETQRHVEIMQHSHLLDAAAEHPPESPARLLAVFGFACSLVSTCVRTSKPFKDLQGGTFEMVADDDEDEDEVEGEKGAGSSGGGGGGPAPRRRGRRFRALAEKVQHSPPVVAFCVQGERWTFEAHDELHVELSLRGLKMHPRGACRLTFIDDDDDETEGKKEEDDEEQGKKKKKQGEHSPPPPPPPPPPPTRLPRKPDEYRWNTPAFYVRDLVPSGSPGHMMRVSHKGPFFAKCMATGDAVVAVAAEADGRQARAAAARGRALMSSVSGRYEPGPGRPAFAAEISGRLDGVVTARVRREHALPPPPCSSPCSSSSLSAAASSSPPPPPLLGCDPERFDGGGGRGFSGHAREALSAWHGGDGGGGEGNDGGGGGSGEGGGGRSDSDTKSSSSSPFVLLPLFRGTTAHHRSQRGCGPWGMSPWACSLNDCPEDLLAALPLTDARRRRDVALVERGDGDAADAEKERMEARQRVDRAAAARALREWKEARGRERRRARKEAAEAEARARRASPSPSASGEAEEGKKEEDGDISGAAAVPPPPSTATAEAPDAASSSKRRGRGGPLDGERPRPFGAPRWFRSVPGTDVWGNPYSRWVYSGGYWEARERGEWPRGTRDPYA